MKRERKIKRDAGAASGDELSSCRACNEMLLEGDEEGRSRSFGGSSERGVGQPLERATY
jgi:hypothetical protein